MTFLTEQEEIEVRKIIENKILMGALKKIFLQDIYGYGTLEKGVEPNFLKNFALSLLFDPSNMMEYSIDNGKLGEKLRACLEGIRLVQTSFNKLEKYKQEDVPKKEEANPAR